MLIIASGKEGPDPKVDWPDDPPPDDPPPDDPPLDDPPLDDPPPDDPPPPYTKTEKGGESSDAEELDEEKSGEKSEDKTDR